MQLMSPWFPDATRISTTLNYFDLDNRRLIDAQHSIVMEVALLDPATLEGDLSPQRCCDAEDDTALDLGHDNVRIDSDASVQDAHDTVDVHLTGLQNRDLGNLRHEATECIVHADAAAASVRKRLTPTRNFGRSV